MAYKTGAGHYPTQPYSSIWFNTNNIGMATFIDSCALSIDSGRTWNNISSSGALDCYTMAGSGIKDFWYPDGGGSGYIFHTTDYGSSWTSEFIQFTQFFAIDFITIGTNAIGYVAGLNGSIARFSGSITSVQTKGNLPNYFSLEQNYPNPFNPTTTINFSLPVPEYVKLTVYDMEGRCIKTLISDILQNGSHTIQFNASMLSSGIYFYRIDAGLSSITRKMILLK